MQRWELGKDRCKGGRMVRWLATCALGGLALPALGCSGRDISLSTTRDQGGFGGPVASGGASNGAGGSNVDWGASRGGTSSNDETQDQNSSGEAGRSGWIAYDANLKAAGFPGRHIRIATVDGVCNRELTNGAAQEKQPAFSANGKQIAFASDATGIFQIYVMDLATGRRTQMTDEPEGASYPSWSPNGKKIAYVTGDVEDHSNLSNSAMLVDTKTFDTTTLTGVQAPPFSWSSFVDNDLLLIGQRLDLVGIHIDPLSLDRVVPFKGRAPQLASPSVSPDGSEFVVSDVCAGSQQLYVARVDGTTGDTCSNAMPLATSSDELISASWGPSGYVAAETGSHDIVLVPSDGTPGIRVLVNTQFEERNPAFAPASVYLDCSE
jgi:dipeptidyl aminopeptidase/acylaminoacyl peptidase